MIYLIGLIALCLLGYLIWIVLLAAAQVLIAVLIIIGSCYLIWTIIRKSLVQKEPPQ